MMVRMKVMTTMKMKMGVRMMIEINYEIHRGNLSTE